MALQLNNITKFYKYGKTQQNVIEDLSITFPRFGLVGIIGKSGCGKSTLLNIIAGLEKPNKGTVNIDGHPLDYHHIDEYRRSYISYLYQFYNLVEALTIKENILLLTQVKRKQVKDNWQELVAQLGLTSLLDYYPRQLSGGQKQRVGLLRAFLCDTPILLADEPTGALNAAMAIEVMKLLKKYARNHLVIVISHNQPLIKQYTNAIIDLNQSQGHYNFLKTNCYHKYLYEIPEQKKPKLGFYLKRQIIYQKKKLIMMFCSQIFTMVAFVLLLSGVNGGYQFIQDNLNSDPLSEVIEATKIDYLNSSFTDDEIKQLNKNNLIDRVTFKYNFNQGVLDLKDIDNLNYYQLSKKKHFKYTAGKFPSKDNQILINQTLANSHHLIIGSELKYTLNEKKYSFIVEGIINDQINTGANIYFSNEHIEESLKTQLIDHSSLIIESSKFKELNKKYNRTYFLISMHQEYLDSYENLFVLANLLISFFLGISFMISLILIAIILKTIFIERRKDTCLLLANGLTKKEVRHLFGIEASLMGILLGFLGSCFGGGVLILVNSLNLGVKLFSIKRLFVLPSYFLPTDIFIFLMAIYGGACFIAARFASKKINRMDISILLKED